MGDRLSMMAMAAMNDHTEEDLINDTRRTMQQITDRYKSAYLWGILQKIRKDVSGMDEEKKFELLQRKWISYNRPLRQGTMYVLGGNKKHKKWRRRFCVLLADYSFEVYESEESYNHGVKPLYSQKHSSYEIVSNIDFHINEICKVSAREFGYMNYDSPSMSKKLGVIGNANLRPTPHIIALYHAYRSVLYLATDSEIEKDMWLKSFKDAARHLAGVQGPSEISRVAFASAIEETYALSDFCDTKVTLAGEQKEIIADFISDLMANDCKTVLLPKMRGGLPFKFKMWDMLSRKVFGLVKELVDNEYPTKCSEIEKDCNNRRNEIMTLIPQIDQTYETVKGIVCELLDEDVNPKLEKEVFSKLPDLLSRMTDAFMLSLHETQELFSTLVDGVQHQLQINDVFANNIDQYFINNLDFAPRNPDFMVNVFESSTGAKSALAMLSSSFPEVDMTPHYTSICIMLQNLLDSAICTFQKLCGDAVNRDNGHLYTAVAIKAAGRVSKKLQYDMTTATKRLCRDVILGVCLETCGQEIDNIAKSKHDELSELIPENVAKYMPLCNLFTDIMSESITKKIQPALSIVTKSLTTEFRSMAKYHSNSTLNSCHSVASSVSDGKCEDNPAEVIVNENIEPEQNNLQQESDGEEEDNALNNGEPCRQNGETGECENSKKNAPIVDENGEIINHVQTDSTSQSESSSHGDERNNNINNCDVNEDCQRNGFVENVTQSEIKIAEQDISKCGGEIERIVKTGEEKLI